MCIDKCVTWAVAAKHPGLDEGGRDTDVVEEAAVLTARLQPRTSDQHLDSTLQHTNKGHSLTSHTVVVSSSTGNIIKKDYRTWTGDKILNYYYNVGNGQTV